MSTKKKVTALKPADNVGSKALATIDQELQQEVSSLKEQIGQPAGRNLKVEPSGNIKTPEGLDLGDQIQIVVVDFVSRNNFYSTPFNPQNPTPPDCYAIGKVIGSMKPEDDSPNKQSDSCSTCPLNAFGSGNNGKSKACGNRRELAVLLVDPDNPDAVADPSAPIYVLSVPPTSLRAFDGIVPAIARSLGGPPIKAIITVTAKPIGTYAALSFHDPVPNKHYALHAARRSECVDLLNRKPDFAAYAARAQPVRRPPARQMPARTAAGGRR